MNLVPPSDPILWEPCALVTDIATQVAPHLDEMRALMTEKGGVGLAANQVGVPYAFCLVTRHDGVKVLINPKIIDRTGWRVSRLEGCLTWPGRETYVPRHQIVRAEWTDAEGVQVADTLVLTEARIVDHEVDHLLGRAIFPRPVPVQS